MATKNNNFALLPSGAVDWLAAINDFMNKVEAGRTFKVVAGEALVLRQPVAVDATDGKAYKAQNTDEVDGIWQSASTAQEAEGYMQIGGTMSYVSWNWTKGGRIYAISGELTQTPTSYPCGKALSATEIVICPYMRA
jgi:hypothetical protein